MQNYTFSFANGILDVTPAPTTTTLGVSVASSTYGQPETLSATVTAAGDVPTGTVTFLEGTSILGMASLSDGTAAITISALLAGIDVVTAVYGGDSNDLGSASGLASISVSPALLTVAANSASRAYGMAEPSFTASYSGFVLGQTLGDSGVTGTPSLVSTDTAASPVGTYTITAGLGSLAAENYTFSFVNGTLSVAPAMLTVIANNASRVYGAFGPSFTASYSGFVLNQTLGDSGVSGAPSLTSTDTAASPVGSYTITAALGTLTAGDYNFTFANGVLSVTPATLTVTANPASRTYGT